MEVLAVIPARGGSKGLPGKNIRALAGHPLIAYSVAAARQTPGITRTVCSTDDAAIAEIARQYGAEVPFMRPAHLAQDLSTDLEVFAHLLAELEAREGYVPDLVVQLRPTSPLRRVADITYALEQMQAHPQAQSIRAVAESPKTPYKMWTLPSAEAGSPYLQPILPAPPDVAEPFNAPRQVLPAIYVHTGMLDVVRPAVVRAGSMSGRQILPLVHNAALAVDIDTLADFEKAQARLATLPGLVRP